ncbi:hypothetical protein HHK36_033240 [Tetracentron sinense]|uniref:Uncharacterized protein n=1 Tax=Tetracentron sinense TaxID=13715 RepID=A0A834Y3Q7_TETSI|nr:hypothetical protein HHK36_033240 [Tetracentron sinense]
MSSLEEPLGLDNLPNISVDRLQRFSSSACRPRVDEIGMGNCWIEGRNCSSSNSCNDEYTSEAFPWRRQTRDVSHGDSLNRRTSSMGRNHRIFGSTCDSWYFPDRQYSSHCNDSDIRDITNKGCLNSNLMVYMVVQFLRATDAEGCMEAIRNVEGARLPVVTHNLTCGSGKLKIGGHLAAASESFQSSKH